MPPEPSWSCRECHASQASSPASCPSHTSPPSKGSTAPLLQESCFLSPVGFHHLPIEQKTQSMFFKCRVWLTRTVWFSAFFVLLAMAIYTGVTVNFLGKRFGDWRFSWSYILGWVAMLMTFFAGVKWQNATPSKSLILRTNSMFHSKKKSSINSQVVAKFKVATPL